MPGADQSIRLVRLPDGGVCLHGTTVAWGDRALCLIGPSGSGKTGTAVQMMALGADLVSDDLTCFHLCGSAVQSARPTLEGRAWPTDGAMTFGCAEGPPEEMPFSLDGYDETGGGDQTIGAALSAPGREPDGSGSADGRGYRSTASALARNTDAALAACVVDAAAPSGVANALYHGSMDGCASAPHDAIGSSSARTAQLDSASPVAANPRPARRDGPAHDRKSPSLEDGLASIARLTESPDRARPERVDQPGDRAWRTLRDRLVASPPEGSPDLIELRGIGPCPVPRRRGVPLSGLLVLTASPGRLPPPTTVDILGVPIPLLRHPATVDLAAKALLWLKSTPAAT